MYTRVSRVSFWANGSARDILHFGFNLVRCVFDARNKRNDIQTLHSLNYYFALRKLRASMRRRRRRHRRCRRCRRSRCNRKIDSYGFHVS